MGEPKEWMEDVLRKQYSQEQANLRQEIMEYSCLTSGNQLSTLNPDSEDLASMGGIEETRELQTRFQSDRLVLSRICELARMDHWSPCKISRAPAFVHGRTHQDFLLEEMRWLAEDFARERRFKLDLARRISTRVVRQVEESRDREAKEAKQREQEALRIAARQAREVKRFWENLSTLVGHHMSKEAEKEKRQVLNLHLEELVDQTERFSSLLAQGLTAPSVALSSTTDGAAVRSTNDDLEGRGVKRPRNMDDVSTNLPTQDSALQEASLKIEEVVENRASEDLPNDCAAMKESSLNAVPDGEKQADGVQAEQAVLDAAALATAAQPTGTTLQTTNIRITLPVLLRGSLREYQQIGLDWLVTMHEKGLNGILADEMGLGKTVMTISLLAYLAGDRGEWGPHLVVVPTSLLLNWEMEFKRWCPGLKILTYFGSQKERRAKRVGWSKPHAFHICITSYNIVLKDSLVLRRKKWQYLILDEAHHIKNFRSQRWQTLLSLNSEHRLLLTGTPLQNSLIELWSLMHFLMPQIFQSHSQFKLWFSKPMEGFIEGIDSLDEGLLRRLHSILRPFLLRRLKRDVEQQLPPKFEHVVLCTLSKRQKILYEEFMANSDTRSALRGGNYFAIANVLMQLRKVCNHPDLFAERPIASPFDQREALLQRVPLVVDDLFEQITRREESCEQLSLALPRLWSHPSGISGRSNIQRLVELSDFEGRMLVPYPASSSVDDILKMHDSSWPPVYFPPKEEQLAWLRTSTEQRVVRGVDPLASESMSLHLHDRTRSSLSKTGIPLGCGTIAERTSYMESGDAADLFRVAIESDHSRLENHFDRLVGEPVVLNMSQRVDLSRASVENFICTIPRSRARAPEVIASRVHSSLSRKLSEEADRVVRSAGPALDYLRPAYVRKQLYFPDKRLLQYDCGKLQRLAEILPALRSGGHRCLIFTQMSRMLDILEAFINMLGYTYLRLDGSTRVEQRQQRMEKFNQDPRVFLFILSTRAGGIGVNLTGADTVIFYDSDWNPAMDQQAQDRCHRIGQTREVHIYRLVTEHTVEENILRKALQKQQLYDIVITEGGFTPDQLPRFQLTDFLDTADQSLLTVDPMPDAAEGIHTVPASSEAWSRAVDAAEDEDDRVAGRAAAAELASVWGEFDDNATGTGPMLLNNQQQQDGRRDNNDLEKVSVANSTARQSNVDSVAEDEEDQVEYDPVLQALNPIQRYAYWFVARGCN